MSVPVNPKRTFIPADLDLSNWEVTEPYFLKLLERTINTPAELKQWLLDWDELSNAIEEYYLWCFIRFTARTNDEGAQKEYSHVTGQVYPQSQGYENKLKKKLIDSPAVDSLNEPEFFVAIRKIKQDIHIFREENLELSGKEQMLAAEYNKIRSAQLINHNGEDMALDKAALLLKCKDREVRKEIFDKIVARRMQDVDKLDDLLTELVTLRHQLAKNAGFDNYIDFRFAQWGRFDYTPDDCLAFHKVIADTVVPVERRMHNIRKEYLQLDTLRPWDTQLEMTDREPLRPSQSSDELLEKTITCFGQLDQYFGDGLRLLKDMKHLDIESRPEKIKGVGYNATLPESRVPFIMQNYNDSERDRMVLIHEGGHAMHSLLTANLEYSFFRLRLPLEVAEVASKGMELLTIKYWDVFYSDPEDAKMAEKIKLGSILSYLLYFSLGDSFERWLYENPTHTVAERRAKWMELCKVYSTGVTSYEGYEHFRQSDYQDISPVYILPFYLVAYSFSDLAAISIWRNFMKDPTTTIQQYKAALSLGNKRTVPELYKEAGVEFDFSRPYVQELMSFVEQRITDMQTTEAIV